jgi:aminopeptidase N
MKIIFIALVAFASISYGQEYPAYFNTINNIALAEGKANAKLFSAENVTSASLNFDITYYRCEWQVDPAVRYIKGKITSYFKITSTGDYIAFDLMDSLTVDSVKQRDKLLTYEHVNNGLKINFESSISAGTTDSISIYYQGIPPGTGFGSFVTSVHAGVPVLWTLSEPYGSRDWWPCKNGLDDKADSIDVIITNPLQYTAASNGLRQSETILGSNKITHWKHRYPIATYLICIAVTNYKELNDSVQLGNVNLPMQTFCYPESINIFKANTHFVLSSMQYFSSLLGTYPFIKEKYGQVQFGWSGGQEHQTSTFIVTPKEGLMAHELAHQWFGDKITCSSWRDIWLNEGFATHFYIMDYERKYPQLANTNRNNENTFITSLAGGSVWVDDTTSVNRIFDSRLSYFKGSHLLFMLRWKLGDSIFFKGIRKYLNDSSIIFGFAKTEDLKRNLEEASGVDLTEFFDDWFYGEGYPSYNVRWTQIGNDYVKINMSQTTSHPSVSFFPLPVALKFKNATQEKTIVVDNKYNGEIFFKNIGFIADTVIIDPDIWLITKNNSSQKVSDNTGNKNVVQVFPNPFVDKFAVYLRNFSGQYGTIKIFNSLGQLLFQKNIIINGSLFTEINEPGLARGIYLLKVETSDKIKITKKILKQ